MRQLLKIIILFFSLLTVTQAQTTSPKTLSLEEAILLAVRENPNVQQSQLNHVVQKFSLEVQHWAFQPHFSFQTIATTTHTVSNNFSQNTNSLAIQPQATWLSPVGTQVTLNSTNNVGEHYNPGLSLQIVQPLMRGFGKPVVEAALYNAIDSEEIGRLNINGTLRTTVTAVVNAYLDVISAQHVLKIDNDALARAQTSVTHTKMFIQAGRKAGVELVTVEADVANAQTKLENDKNNFQQMRYALLTAIGIDPSTNLQFSNLDIPSLIKKYDIPPLDIAKKMVLENDIQYETDQITLHGATKRSLLTAEDNNKWKLDLSLNAAMGNGAGSGRNAGISSLTNGANQTQSAMLTLNIPIDDKNAQEAILNAKIAIQEAEIALKQERWQKETNAINGWNTISSAERALKFAENAEALQEKTYNISFQKYAYGLIDSLELQTAQQQFTVSQQALLDARVAYLKSLVNMDQLDGSTLRTWNVEVHYE